MRLRTTLLVVALLGLVPSWAFAGEQANAPTSSGETGLFTLLSGDTLPAHGWDFGLYYNNWDPVFKNPGPLGPAKVPIDWNRLDLSVGYGLTDRWELSVAVPYDYYDFDKSQTPFNPDHKQGLANLRVGTKFRLFGAAGDANTGAINLFVTPNTGRTDFANTKTGFGGGLDFRFSNFVLDAQYGKDTTRFDGVNFDDEVHVGLGYAARIGSRFDWITEVAYSHFGSLGYRDRFDLTSGGRLWFGEPQNWNFNFGLRVDMAQLNSISDHCPLGGIVGDRKSVV